MTNAPSTFVTYMNEVFKKHIGIRAVVYLDNIIIFSKTKEQHLKDVRAVLQTLQDNQLYAKPSKCQFFQKELPFLGHIVGANRIKPNPKKVRSVKDMPPPRNKKELRTFLGMIAYVRRFIKDCSNLTTPLTKRTGKNCKFEWTPLRNY